MALLLLLLLVSLIAMLALATVVGIAVDISAEERIRRVHVHEAYDGTLVAGIENEPQIFSAAGVVTRSAKQFKGRSE